MAIKPLIILPDPILRKISQPVERIDAAMVSLAHDMLETMYHAPGIGLAAIQIGLPLRLLVMDVTSHKKEEGEAGEEIETVEKNPLILFNPEILCSSDERNIYQEGCLSIPDYYADVERPKQVRVRYIDEQGKSREMEADGLLATCVQHEIDHLDGRLFIDHLSRVKREMVIRKFKKRLKEEQDSAAVL